MKQNMHAAFGLFPVTAAEGFQHPAEKQAVGGTLVQLREDLLPKLRVPTIQGVLNGAADIALHSLGTAANSFGDLGVQYLGDGLRRILRQ